MKRLALFLLASALLFAQGTLTLVNTGTPPAAGYAAGAVVPLAINAAGNNTCGAGSLGCVTGAEFTVTTTAGTIAFIAPASFGSAKTLACSPSSPYTCLLVGLNNITPIPAGLLATVSLTIPTPAPTTPITVTLSNPVEADGAGNGLVVTVLNPTVSLSPVNRCAVTGDSSVSSADTSAVINEALTGMTTPATDLNSDGKTNVLDAQIVATAGSGGPCNAH